MISASIWRRPADFIVFLYFLTHIPITIFIDSQVVLRNYINYPSFLTEMCNNYAVNMQDKLVSNPPLWFQVFTACELILQFPFFFFACYAYYFGRNWIRIPAIVYGVHVVTTLIPILSAQIIDPTYRPSDNVTLLGLISIYSIYLFTPLYVAVSMIFNDQPFVQDKNVTKKLE